MLVPVAQPATGAIHEGRIGCLRAARISRAKVHVTTWRRAGRTPFVRAGLARTVGRPRPMIALNNTVLLS